MTFATVLFSANRVSRLNANDDAAVTATCFRLFDQANYRRNRIRTVLINASDLRYYARQLDLFTGGDPRDRVLSGALDKVRKKYGFGSVGIGGQGQSGGKRLEIGKLAGQPVTPIEAAL